MIIEGKKVMVTGAAGFIGSHLVDRLLSMKCEVIGIDNLSSGKEEFLKSAKRKRKFKFIKYDLLEDEGLEEYMDGVSIVFHLAANPDVRIGESDSSVHLEQNIIATYVVLEAMRAMGVPAIAFTSTSTVYGEADKVPTPEDYGPLVPISLYGGSKLAAEAMISAYAHTFDMKAVLYRFANVVGPRSTHGVIYDFIEKLKNNPNELEILGAEPGTRKSYVHIDDTIEGIIHGVHVSMDRVSIYNIGSEDMTDVKTIADIVSEEMGLKPEYKWTGGVDGGRGWKGDVKLMHLDISALKSKGWSPKMSSDEAVRATVRALLGKE